MGVLRFRAGVPFYTANATGQSVSLGTDSSTNFSLPTTVTPNGTSSMNSNVAYASSWAPTSMTGPNGDTGTTTYDSYGRPSQTTTPDGATTTYTYTYTAGASTQTATLDGRWQTTTLDGFGRTIQVQKGNGSTVVSTVQTQYGPCGCSPLDRVTAVSEPFAPSATVYWTTYTHDGSGRTLTLTAPDSASMTTYAYTGNSTTVTDPANSQKTSTVDAFGNLVFMSEPNPAGGTFLTTYNYTPANQLTKVTMTRGSITQNRIFLYNGSDLTTASNPETGTVSYTYDYAHHVTSRTDAVGSKTQYTYDAYGRLSETQYYPAWGPWEAYGTYNEDPFERVTYSYDSGTNGIGRLTGVTFGGGVKDDLYDAHLFTYAYAYNPAGRITNQTVTVQRATGSAYNYLPPINPPIATFTAGYTWDDEGRMTGMVSPTVAMSSYSSYPNPVVMPTMGYQYDINGRMTGMTSNTGGGPVTFASASYTAAGQLYQLSYGGMTETRTYNSMMQLISQSVPGYLSMNYNYSTTGHNNGRIVSSSDGITGENTSYTYDALNRLTSASNSLWSESYGYDGFGNLTSKTGSGGSPNAAPSMSVSYNANNQQTAGVSYDANGNTSAANGYSYGYTVENKMTSATSIYSPYGETLYAYDPSGKRVMKETNPDPNNYVGDDVPFWEFYFYSITGQKLATMDCNNPSGNPIPSCWVVGENVYFGRKLLVSNGVYVVTDRLGSVRPNTQSEAFAYYPYGEERTNRPDGREKFATYFRDGVGQDYADQRYYSGSEGRFWSPDPGGIKTARPANPVSWNRYAYGNGDPVNFFDPHGLIVQAPPAGGPSAEDCIMDPDYCEAYDWNGGGDGGGGCGSSAGMGFIETPDPDPSSGCPANDSPPAPPPASGVSLRETSACTEAKGRQTGNFTLDITYQVMVNGAPVTSATQLYNLGIYFISEQLTNPTGTMGTSGANWCLGMASASCPSPGQVGELQANGTFVDELSGQGTLTQSFYLNGTGAALQVAFAALSFVGPLQSYTILNNTYNSRGKPPSVTVAGGAFSSEGAPSCDK